MSVKKDIDNGDEKLSGFYVYTLSDPRCGQVFYIGKGKGRIVPFDRWKKDNNPSDEYIEYYHAVVAELQDIAEHGYQSVYTLPIARRDKEQRQNSEVKNG